jgi:hypothetical protein
MELKKQKIILKIIPNKMANLIDTRLECITNYELLKCIDPQKIIIKTNSRFQFSIGDELVFESRWMTMHEDILQLSIKFPNEVFLARYYFIYAECSEPALCVRYINGKHEFLGYEMDYDWGNYQDVLKEFGQDVFHRLWRRVRKYFFRLDETNENVVTGKVECDILEHHFDECVSSYVTVHAEYLNYKMSVDKNRRSKLHFRGYRRSSESGDWEEINIPKSSEKENGKNDPYEEALPPVEDTDLNS